jgi:hypothetical protein
MRGARLTSTRSRAAAAALAACAWLILSLAVAGPAAAGEWQGCSPLPVTTAGGSHYRATGIEAKQVDCEAAAAIVRGFYSQEIGSSGATEVEGFGCAYQGGNRVLCAERVGSVYDGPRRVRWSQRAPGVATSGSTRVAGCRPFMVFHAYGRSDSDYRASHVRRSAAIRCSLARKLLKAAYHTGPLRVIRTVYGHDSQGRRAGRPTYWLRDGWRCSNGAGGAACWNVRKQPLNAIPVEGLDHGLAVTAEVGFRG